MVCALDRTPFERSKGVHVKRLVIATIAISAVIAAAAVSATAQHADVPVSGLNMDAVPNIDHDGIRQVQSLLKQKGFSPGPADGVEGPLTKAAVGDFQKRYGIKTRGVIDNETLLALGAVNLARPAAN
jgi:peptidoglycan hydrolase-like protein with peptidoglycan-binding domain